MPAMRPVLGLLAPHRVWDYLSIYIYIYLGICRYIYFYTGVQVAECSELGIGKLQSARAVLTILIDRAVANNSKLDNVFYLSFNFTCI